MNTTPNPLIPQGTFLEQKGRSHIRLAVFTILAVHVVLLGSLLLAGCKPTTEQTAAEQTNDLATTYPSPPVTPIPVITETSPPSVPATTDVATTTANTSYIVGATGAAPTGITSEAQGTTSFPPTPLPGSETPLVGAPPQGEHVIVKGDSFYTVAKKYSVTSRAIQEANPGVDPSRLKIGQKLVIPARTATATAAAPSNGTATNGGTKTYTVKSGDTLNAIAKRHGITVKQLQAANNLATTQIKVGQKLRIPSKEVPPPQ
jgi:LysM repeat protein